MKRSQLLLDQLILYSQTDRYPFHMPGHKRRGYEFPNPYSIDITEIDGFDNLYHAEGILKESMDWAASVYGSDYTYYLVNGSSGGILSAVNSAVDNGGKILVSRNCHKSVYHGVILSNLDVEYVYPQFIEPLGIQGGILAEDVENRLEENPDIQAVLIVSPTYDGIVSDIRRIADAVHQRGIPFIVDEAHGAHFSFGGNAGFPCSALNCGADLVIQSLHKTLPSFTQTAVLHLRDGFVNRERLERYLQMFQSSSPSYIFMAGIEACIDRMEKDGDACMKLFSRRIEKLRNRLAMMKNLTLIGKNLCGHYGVYDVDESKIVVSVRNCFWLDDAGQAVLADGIWLDQILRDEFHLEMEMTGVDYVVAITTFMDTQDGLTRLEEALVEIDGRLHRESGDSAMKIIENPVIRMKMGVAVDAPYEELELVNCDGRISTEFIYLYPPGIPIVAPGELVTGKVIEMVLRYRKLGLPVQGMADVHTLRLRVVKNHER